MNPTVEQLTIPYQRAMTFLSYIRGPLVDDWVDEQAEWLMNQVQTGVAHGEENLWRTIEVRFRQAFTDTAEKAKAQHQLQDFRMKGDDIDTYISTFQNLARKAGYTLDENVTLGMFADGLPPKLMVNCVKFDHPHDWNDWINSARLHQEEYIQLRDRLKGGPRNQGHTQSQWKNALNRNPNAMDIGRTRARVTATDDKGKQRSEGRCFKCNQQGHISRYCPQRSDRPSAITASVALTSPTPLSNQQKAQAYLATLHSESEEVRNAFAEELFAQKQDFLNA